MADEKLKVAGIKLKIDGAATFSDNLNKINSRLKTNSAELKKVMKSFSKCFTKHKENRLLRRQR